MKTPLISMVSLLLFGSLSSLSFGQQSVPRNNMFSSDLVMWSYMQEAQPEPGPARQTPTPDPSPETQPQQSPSVPQTQPTSPSQSQNASRPTQDASGQSFTGTISKDADNFILRVSDGVSYKLDNQQQVQEFEGKRVRVTGTLDTSINLIHVEKVEPLT